MERHDRCSSRTAQQGYGAVAKHTWLILCLMEKCIAGAAGAIHRKGCKCTCSGTRSAMRRRQRGQRCSTGNVETQA